MRFYTGIGSRSVPEEVSKILRRAAEALSANWVCRTGTADGCDAAFRGPWPVEVHGTEDVGPVAMAVGKGFHPVWDHLTPHQQKLIARNTYQLTGRIIERLHRESGEEIFSLHRLREWMKDSRFNASKVVICWTPDAADGVTVKTSKLTGGTGQAIRIAAFLGIKVINLADPAKKKLFELLEVAKM